MSPRRASFTEKDVRRALKAAKAEGFARVELIPSPEGLKLVIERDAKSTPAPASVEELEI